MSYYKLLKTMTNCIDWTDCSVALKIIDRLTNQSQASGLQPIKRIDNGEIAYAFDVLVRCYPYHHVITCIKLLAVLTAIEF